VDQTTELRNLEYLLDYMKEMLHLSEVMHMERLKMPLPKNHVGLAVAKAEQEEMVENRIAIDYLVKRIAEVRERERGNA
jgi:hypothetical protein